MSTTDNLYITIASKTRKIIINIIVISITIFCIPSVIFAADDCCRCSNPQGENNVCLIPATGGSCNSLISDTNNTDLKDFICDSKGLENAECKKIGETASAKCINNPISAITYHPASPTTSPKKMEEEPIILNIAIPGLKFSQPSVVKKTMSSPYLAQYVNAIYNYGLGIIAITAAIMMIYGGFRYIIGATTDSISRGKEIVIDSMIGLLLVMGMYSLLWSLNTKLVELSALEGISIIQRDALDDPVLEEKRVRESATITHPKEEEMPVIYSGLKTPSQSPSDTQKESPSATGNDGQTVPSSQPNIESNPPIGTVIKNEKGEYIAQDNCPSDMVAIRYSSEYALYKGEKSERKIHVPSFCMDRYEAPNQAGVKPFNGVTEWEADWYCHERGKYLCSSKQWQRACLGPQGDQVFMYGKKYIPGRFVSAGKEMKPDVSSTNNPPAPCNYDSQGPGTNIDFAILNLTTIRNFKPETSILNADNPYFTSQEKIKGALGGPPQGSKYVGFTYEQGYKRLKEYLADYAKPAEPSGTRRSCVSQEGVYDLTANLQEITTSDVGVDLTTEQRIAKGLVKGATKPYAWVGFYFAPIAHLGNTKKLPDCYTTDWGGVHEAGMRTHENGFRCCMHLSEKNE